MKQLAIEEQLEQLIHDENIALERAPLLVHGMRGHYYRSSCMDCAVITIDQEIEQQQEQNAVVGHELGHHFTLRSHLFLSTRRQQEREEALAHRWAAEFFLSPDRLIAAHKKAQISTADELAEHLDISEDELYRHLSTMQDIHGRQLVHGEYIIQWLPFCVRKQ